MNIMRKKGIITRGRKRMCCILAVLLFIAHCPVVRAAPGGGAVESEGAGAVPNGTGGSEGAGAVPDGMEGDDAEDRLLAPYFIIQGTGDEAPPVERFPLKSTDVVTNINGMIAETYVTQTYVNEGDIPINASYVFPTSSGVAVHGMKMVIGNEMITARIKEKEEAKAEFEEAKSEGKSASVMEQKRPNVFTMDVANIMPGDSISIELHYTELITPKENVYEFVFPTVVGPRYAPPAASGGDGNGVEGGKASDAAGSEGRSAGDAAGSEGGSADDAAGSEGGSADDAAGSEDGKAGDAAGSEDGKAGDAAGSEGGKAGDAAGSEGGKAGDAAGSEDGKAGGVAGSEGGKASDAAGSEGGSAGDAAGNEAGSVGDSDSVEDGGRGRSVSGSDGNAGGPDGNEGGSAGGPVGNEGGSAGGAGGNEGGSAGGSGGNEGGGTGSSGGNVGGSAGGPDDDGWVESPYLADGATPPGDYNITVNLSTGVPIAGVTCKSHEIRVNKGNASSAQITLANPDDYAGNRDFILKYKLTGEEIQSGLVLSGGQTANEPFEPENFFMLTIQPPERFEPEDIPPREYIFVLDVSGSMFGYPLDTAKELIRDLLINLKETDTFNLVLFAKKSTLFSPESLPANAKNIEAAIKLIDEQEGGGGTSLLPALKDAVGTPKKEDTARSVVIITDGYVSNESDIISYITKKMDSASFFSFGIGSSVNDYLVKQIAGCGLGESFIVTDSEDAAQSAEDFRTYIGAPLLTDIDISFGGFEVYDVEPAVPSVLYAAQPIVLFGKWKGEPEGTITVTGHAGGEEYVQEIPVGNVEVDMEGEAIRYLWARTHLDRITGYGSIRNDESVREKVTQLGLEYNMITPYTSFIAVSEMIRNTEENSTDVAQALPLPQRVSNLAVGGGYRAYSEPGAFLLVLPVAAVFLLTAKRKVRRPGKGQRL